MNIDWKARLTNKTFWVAITSAVVILVQQLGFKDLIPSNWSEIVNSVLTIFILLGIIVDPSTSGISDKTIADTTIQELNKINESKEEVKTEATTTSVNNTINQNSASSKITVDNPDNTQAIGATVNHISAKMPQ